MYTYVHFELSVFFNIFVLTFFVFYIQNVHAHARLVSPGFVQQVMPNAFILPKDRIEESVIVTLKLTVSPSVRLSVLALSHSGTHDSDSWL